MIRNYAIVRESAARAASAAQTALDGLREGRVQNEESFTDRMIGAIERSFDEWRVKQVAWRAMTLTAHQRNAQESEFGADFLGVLDINLSDYNVRKGFLAQAKLIEPDASISTAEFNRMKAQCVKMLEHTPDAFIFLYCNEDVFVVPANSVLGLQRRENPHALYSRRLARFFEEHFESFIGDPRLHRPDKDGLEELRFAVEARRVLMLSAG